MNSRSFFKPMLSALRTPCLGGDILVQQHGGAHMMPWQAYVDSSLLGSGLVDNAIVFAKHDDYTILAASPGYLVTREELTEARKIFAEAGTGPCIQKARETGFRIAGTTYRAVKGDGRSLYGVLEKQGIMVVNSARAIFIVHYPESSSQSETANLIEQLCDYLISVGS